MNDHTKNGQGTLTWIVVGLLVVVGILLIGSYAGDRDLELSLDEDIDIVDEQEDGIDLMSAPEETLDEMTENPEPYYGRTVTVEGEVEEVLTPNAFIIDAPGVFNDELLVISDDPFDFAEMVEQDWEIDGDVLATGTLREFRLITTSGIVDFDLDPDILTIYEGEPVLEASIITLEND